MSDTTEGFIHVEYNPVNNAADDMVGQTQAIARTLSSLDEELNDLKQNWLGDDATVYNQKQAAWDGAIQTMEHLLNSHATLLNDVAGHYKYTEQSLSQLWSEVSIGQ